MTSLSEIWRRIVTKKKRNEEKPETTEVEEKTPAVETPPPEPQTPPPYTPNWPDGRRPWVGDRVIYFDPTFEGNKVSGVIPRSADVTNSYGETGFVDLFIQLAPEPKPMARNRPYTIAQEVPFIRDEIVPGGWCWLEDALSLWRKAKTVQETINDVATAVEESRNEAPPKETPGALEPAR